MAGHPNLQGEATQKLGAKMGCKKLGAKSTKTGCKGKKGEKDEKDKGEKAGFAPNEPPGETFTT